MYYETAKLPEKPAEASAKFTVYLVGDSEERYVYCPVRGRAYKVDGKPEEIVRQWWLYRLRDHYGYQFSQIGVEVPVKVGATEAKKKADIVVYKDSTKRIPRIFVEVKKPDRKDGVDQLEVYMNATGCRLGLWSNGAPPHVYLLRVEPKEGEEEASWRELRNIPSAGEDISSVDKPITRKQLEPVSDFLSILRECEDHIKAHEGINVFDEIFKLIFAKLYDERRNLKNDNSPAKFRVGALESAADARVRINKLFVDARAQWQGVFAPGEELNLSDETLAFCVSALQKAYLLKSDADVLGAAFEVMVNPTMKGDKGQYFTPRHVINLCIDVLDPTETETIFDPACGSGGFLVSAMDHVFKQIRSERDDESEILENQKDYATNNVFGMDYDPMIAKVAKAYMLIWGDGRSNISVGDGLNDNNWSDDARAKFQVLNGVRREHRKFDIIATNPPFAGDISADDTLSRYRLAFKTDASGRTKRLKKVSRDVLFLERCLDSLAPGGRMAIVLPRGIFKNYTDERVRRFLMERAKVKAVVSLTGSMFKPFTNTKTCVLFIERRQHDIVDVSKAKKDGPILFAVSEIPGKDQSGKLVRNAKGEIISDLGEIAKYLKKNLAWGGK
ncbi:N-6 DNA methylase [Frateuria terrea]|uniref:Type I restriction enzyme M protein n=1 Tax=Frateuria terrea TaxID=529704 RepID=A0A1H6VQL8_9GAMM|nr:N-6 DNA methylase [Frateuria terrea]SEJ05374.1 type I restriction enzyme M protein [Frateuria terrea]SFP62771.1 type I restriction enzyme M protein [Frateuria terrea]